MIEMTWQEKSSILFFFFINLKIWEVKNEKYQKIKFKQYKSIFSYDSFYRHSKRAILSIWEAANMKTFDESKTFSTCPPSGNQVDGLPLAPRSDEVCYAKVLVNIENIDSYDIEASIWASGWSKWSNRNTNPSEWNFSKSENDGQQLKFHKKMKINLSQIWARGQQGSQ